jgi:hypothetical protein
MTNILIQDGMAPIPQGVGKHVFYGGIAYVV